MVKRGGYLPFQDTKVSVEQSKSDIQAILKRLGFDRVIQMDDRGTHRILAEHNGASFVWEAQPGTIYKALVNKSRGPYNKDRLAEKAEMIAWRVVWAQIKSACDSIQYGVASLAEVLGGQLMVTDRQTGQPVRLAEKIIASKGSVNGLLALLPPTGGPDAKD